MRVLVIIPCYNESRSILKTVESLSRAKLPKNTTLDYIIINDGSTDNTLSILNQNHLSYINLPLNSGIGAAVQTGYKYALTENYDIALQFDGDGQHQAEYIPALIEPIIKNQANFVIGSRFLKQDDSYKSSRLRRIGIVLLSKMIKIISGKTIKDTTSGFRAADRKVIKIFTKNYPAEYPEPVTDLMLAKNSCKIREVPVKMRAREHGKSSITPLKSIYFMLNVFILFIVILTNKKEPFES